jgi:hypothetical protein
MACLTNPASRALIAEPRPTTLPTGKVATPVALLPYQAFHDY